MSRLIRELIGAREPGYSLKIRQLESVTGEKHLDVILAADIITRTAQKVKYLGLDPNNTLPEELYKAIYKTATDCSQLLDSKFPTTKILLQSIHKKTPVVILPIVHPTAIRKILSKHPPKKVMSVFGFRSVDSMLKRGDLDQLLIGAFMMESLTWHRTFCKLLTKLTISEIKMATPRVVIINNKLAAASKSQREVVYIQFFGLAGIVMPKQIKNKNLYLLSQCSRALFHLHEQGIYLKIYRYSSSFISMLIKATYEPIKLHQKIGSSSISWSVVYKCISENKLVKNIDNDAIVSAKDFFWNSASSALPSISTAMDFWSDSESLGLTKVSININDVAVNVANDVPYKHSVYAYRSRIVENRLFAAYVSHKFNEDEILNYSGIID